MEQSLDRWQHSRTTIVDQAFIGAPEWAMLNRSTYSDNTSLLLLWMRYTDSALWRQRDWRPTSHLLLTNLWHYAKIKKYAKAFSMRLWAAHFSTAFSKVRQACPRIVFSLCGDRKTQISLHCCTFVTICVVSSSHSFRLHVLKERKVKLDRFYSEVRLQ